MIAALFATVAFSIDSMLPALPEIAETLTPDNVNRAQLILTSFLFGMGLGTLVVGPLSDAFGRKATIIAGVALYIVASVAAIFAQSLELLLAVRVVQGLGAAAPRVVSLAMVRDIFAGRQMAQIMSFVMMIFVMVPAASPFVGSIIIANFGWRAIFVAFIVFALIGSTWVTLRQPETLPPEKRRALGVATLWSALREVLSHRMVLIYIAVLTLGFGQMFAFLSSVQPVYEEIYGITDSFPIWFLCSGLLSGAGTILNATLVMRLGMRRLAIAAYSTQTVLSAVVLVLTLSGAVPEALAFPLFFVWSVTVFFMAGLTFGNLNALALEPLGHIAGLASSVIGAVSTVGAVILAIPIGLAFNGTVAPLMIGVFCCSGLAWLLMWSARRADPAPKKVVRH
ncbi:Bcr/CflA family efflux MFS transporter [Mesobaculum littorinae]|uniref:Bcr/CflA family efflux transporter n=2 Tax=Mesobaculum littorinae TaxID=2486419 RepID=A0A438AMC2_9RHOB|nr:Bcr/CflA family efflux MFS transporter [Mesobaculum littorinae]